MVPTVVMASVVVSTTSAVPASTALVGVALPIAAEVSATTILTIRVRASVLMVAGPRSLHRSAFGLLFSFASLRVQLLLVPAPFLSEIGDAELLTVSSVALVHLDCHLREGRLADS